MPADAISDRARRLHSSSIVVDAHADTPQRFLFDQFDMKSRDAEGCVDLPRLCEGGVDAIFFALWVPIDIVGTEATKRAFDLLSSVEGQIEKYSADLALATSSQEIRQAHEQGKIAILLGVEGGHAINNDLGALRELAARGVRYMTLTHNAATDWADSSNDAPRHRGLTDFGRGVVREMNRLGMLVDVSHVSDESFRDVIETSSAPVIASHSCCKSICDAPRNLSDELIRSLAKRGGVIHITFHDSFLSQEYADASRKLALESAIREKAAKQTFGGNQARLLIEGQRMSDELIRTGKLPQVRWEKIVEHIHHAVQLVGPDHVGLGSDFDGAFMPEGMEDASKFPKITEELLGLGYEESDVAKILGGNTIRVLNDAQTLGSEL